jgi:hypothetical protein
MDIQRPLPRGLGGDDATEAMSVALARPYRMREPMDSEIRLSEGRPSYKVLDPVQRATATVV